MNTRASQWCGNFMRGVMSEAERKENFRMAKSTFVNFRDAVKPFLVKRCTITFFVVAGRLMCPLDLQRCIDGIEPCTCDRSNHTEAGLWVRGQTKQHPGPPGCGLGVGSATLPHKKLHCYRKAETHYQDTLRPGKLRDL